MRTARVLAAALAAAAAACGAPAPEPARASPEFVAWHVPGGGLATYSADAAARFPSGSRVVRSGESRPEVPLSEGMDAAGAPSLRHDAQAVLFVGREKPGDVLAVWTCAPDGTGRRLAARHATDCLGAAHLPDGRIVYAATLDAPSPAAGVARGAALFVAKGDGTPGARITWTAGLDADPCVLSDGRILFSSWRDREDGGRMGLFTVFPDGTGLAPFHLADGDVVMPRQRDDFDVNCVVVRNGEATAVRVSWDAPMSAPPGAVEGTVKLHAARAEPGLAFAVPLVPRPRPQGQLSVVRDEREYGTVYCADARRGAPGAVRVRVRTWPAAGAEPRTIGEAPLAADGSFHLRLPPDTPLAFEMIDAAGAVVAAERGPTWVRRNEVRGCVGCHDDAETGPPNVRPDAVRAPPADLSGGGLR